MTIRKKTTGKKAVSKTTVPVEVTTVIDPVFLRQRRLTVSVGISSDFGKEKISLSLSENVPEDGDAMKLADDIYDILETKLEEQFALLQGEGSSDTNAPEDDLEEEDFEEEDFEEEDDEEEDEEDEEDEEEDDDVEEISEDDINAMKKDELLALIKDEELDIDLKKCKKVADLRSAVIDILFEEEDEEDLDGEEEDEDWDDEDWDDGDDE